ncbi:MAG TPA: prepilin-type N-terminal cleavage/methylation domain-containing protein [Luteitalea sp.]|nr:prepilin-type N-terminal cleavage/methylation domain-containing protein [Luteitalea sp.]
MSAPVTTIAGNACRSDRGFSLIEVLVSMMLLTGALLGLGQVFLLGMTHVSTSSANLIAREKAREAIESVHTARDTRVLEWNEIRNDAAPRMCAGETAADGWNSTTRGVFNDGEQEGLRLAGDDGLVNTDDDGDVETIAHPGPDGVFGTNDDREEALAQFWREIWICDRSNSLREVRVSVRYRVGTITRTYRLSTYISNYS